MKLPENGQLLRIFISENDTCKGHPLFEQIVLEAQHVHQLAMDTRNLLTAVDDNIDCEAENKISKI